jgi:acetyl esterase/lipase
MRNPASRRAIVHSLAKLTSGRCFSVAYRLSPQNVFPSALLDLLVVYLSLLHPPPGSRHAAVPATDICISGDSSGANIALALLQLILHLQQRSLDGQALATHSGYFDLTRSLPSETANLPFDVIPSPYAPPSPQSSFLPDSIWPASSPRHHVYAPTALLTHPLVSPITSPSWRGCPTRVWLSVGQECLADGSIVLAKRMALQGVAVVLEMYAGMPHDFLVMFMSTKTGQACLESWAAFARESVEGAVGWREKNMNAQADIVRMNGTREAVDLERLEPRYTLEEIVEGMEAQIARWGPP